MVCKLGAPVLSSRLDGQPWPTRRASPYALEEAQTCKQGGASTRARTMARRWTLVCWRINPRGLLCEAKQHVQREGPASLPPATHTGDEVRLEFLVLRSLQAWFWGSDTGGRCGKSGLKAAGRTCSPWSHNAHDDVAAPVKPQPSIASQRACARPAAWQPLALRLVVRFCHAPAQGNVLEHAPQ